MLPSGPGLDLVAAQLGFSAEHHSCHPPSPSFQRAHSQIGALTLALPHSCALTQGLSGRPAAGSKTPLPPGLQRQLLEILCQPTPTACRREPPAVVQAFAAPALGLPHLPASAYTSSPHTVSFSNINLQHKSSPSSTYSSSQSLKVQLKASPP